MRTTKFPARLHVIFARKADTAVIIRRGPAKSVCTILWDRNRDTFELGQWMRGRIYERRCDLSPDGRFFLYFAMNGRWSSEAKGAWTAISHAPYLKAVALFAKGDCWHGGGLFLSNREFWLNDGYGHTELKSFSQLKRNSGYQPPEYFGGECLTPYYNRLQRDGWILLKTENEAGVLFEKKLSKGWVLRKHAFAEIDAPAGRGCYWDAHELLHGSSGTVLVYPEWEWADFDRNRLVWACNGQLWSARLNRGGKLTDETLLHDFNAMKFQAITAPY
jgi:hypothetical protein